MATNTPWQLRVIMELRNNLRLPSERLKRTEYLKDPDQLECLHLTTATTVNEFKRLVYQCFMSIHLLQEDYFNGTLEADEWIA
jgi:hypothetical protein